MKTPINYLILSGLFAFGTFTNAHGQTPANDANASQSGEPTTMIPAEEPVVSHPSPVLRGFSPRFLCVCPGYCPKPEPCKIPRPLCGPTTVNRQTTPWKLYSPFPVRGPFEHH